MNYRNCKSVKKCCSSSSDEDINDDVIQLTERVDNLEKLTERVDKLEKLINDMFSYQPDGVGYQETKTHFETISKV